MTDTGHMSPCGGRPAGCPLFDDIIDVLVFDVLALTRQMGPGEGILLCKPAPNRALTWLRVIWPSNASAMLANSSPTHSAARKCESLIIRCESLSMLMDAFSCRRSCFTSLSSAQSGSLFGGMESIGGVSCVGSVARRINGNSDLRSSLSYPRDLQPSISGADLPFQDNTIHL